MDAEQIAINITSLTSSIDHLNESLANKFEAMSDTDALKDKAHNVRHDSILLTVDALAQSHHALSKSFIMHMDNEEVAMAKLYKLGYIGIGIAGAVSFIHSYPAIMVLLK
jgi:hypothetical protein